MMDRMKVFSLSVASLSAMIAAFPYANANEIQIESLGGRAASVTITGDAAARLYGLFAMQPVPTPFGLKKASTDIACYKQNSGTDESHMCAFLVSDQGEVEADGEVEATLSF